MIRYWRSNTGGAVGEEASAARIVVGILNELYVPDEVLLRREVVIHLVDHLIPVLVVAALKR